MTWWKSTTIYQIYPRSFMDTNNDGIGDLKGIMAKLDYLKDLGIETIWISPFYSSPHQDHGYDITNYLDIDPLFGTKEDALQLIKEVHQRNMKIVLDLVMNHTSIEHPWFKESRSSKDNPKRDWYIWKKGNGKKAPNNWMSMTGKKGWNYDATTDEWYYASFLDFQPDLNYENEEVRNEMFNTVRYWLAQGVDGFRLDIFNCIGKDSNFKNNPFSIRYLPSPAHNEEAYFQHKIHTYNHPKSFQFSKDLRKVVNEYPDRFLIGEISGDDQTLKKFIGENHDGLHTTFLFELIHYKFNKNFFYHFLEKIEKEYPTPYVPTFVYSNHDVGRGIRFVQNDIEKAKVLALFQLTTRGIPVIYYGDEIGMGNHDFKIKETQDPVAIQNRNVPKKLAMKLGIFINRDDCRTPMQWNNSSNAGFSTTTPWLPLIPNYKERNVEVEQENPTSLWNTYKNLLHLRNNHSILQDGTLELIPHKDLLIYKRKLNDETVTIVINFSNQTIPYINDHSFELLFSSHSDNTLIDSHLTLKKHSGCILRKITN